MSMPWEIPYWKKTYKDHTREQLIEVMHTHTEFSTQHIAAKQLLDSLDQAAKQGESEDSERRHRESISESRRANRLAWIAIGISIAGTLIAIVSIALQFADHANKGKREALESASRPSLSKTPTTPVSPATSSSTSKPTTESATPIQQAQP